MCDYTLDDEDVNYLWQHELAFGLDESTPLAVVNGSVNLTSDGGQTCGFNGSSYALCGPTSDGTPTFAFQTQGQVSCKLWHQAKNYSTLASEGVSNCQTTGSYDHICSMTNPLGEGIKALYLSCSDGQQGINNFNQYPANMLNVSIEKTSVYNLLFSGIDQSRIWPGANIYRDQAVFVKTIDNMQAFQVFDIVASYGKQRWGFNYLSFGEGEPIFYNLSPLFYFFYVANATDAEAKSQVYAFISATTGSHGQKRI